MYPIKQLVDAESTKIQFCKTRFHFKTKQGQFIISLGSFFLIYSFVLSDVSEIDYNTRSVSSCEKVDQCDWEGNNFPKADKALASAKTFPNKR